MHWQKKALEKLYTDKQNNFLETCDINFYEPLNNKKILARISTYERHRL